MRDRADSILKIACALLAVLALLQLSRVVLARNPLADFKFPSVPLAATSTTTNSAAQTPSVSPAASAVSSTAHAPGSPGMMGPPGGRPGRPGPVTLPPDVQAQIDRIKDSEILGAIPRPLPMGLLGIAGEDAFIRDANGQVSLMKVGDDRGGIKLLRIGINRVLIEHEGQQKELILHSGFGSQTLMQKGNQP